MKEYKVVVNSCYGGFGLSDKAMKLLAERKGHPIYFDTFTHYKFLLEDDNPGSRYYPPHDKDLVEVVEELGSKANGPFANLKVVTITKPLYKIRDYDGIESIETPEDVDWIKIDDV